MFFLHFKEEDVWALSVHMFSAYVIPVFLVSSTLFYLIINLIVNYCDKLQIDGDKNNSAKLHSDRPFEVIILNIKFTINCFLDRVSK